MAGKVLAIYLSPGQLDDVKTICERHHCSQREAYDRLVRGESRDPKSTRYVRVPEDELATICRMLVSCIGGDWGELEGDDHEGEYTEGLVIALDDEPNEKFVLFDSFSYVLKRAIYLACDDVHERERLDKIEDGTLGLENGT